jgi:hypothetical protein
MSDRVYTSSKIPKSEWHLITATYDNNEMKIYSDGNLPNTIVSTSQTGESTQAFIGYGEGPDYFSGKIDEVRVYSRALSDSEVAKLYSGYDHSIQLTVNVE